jgi:predicted 2-oxoglutarate/Fe(II)-dependent dioxygenase YbiX
MLEPKVFADKIFYYENILYSPESVVQAIEEMDHKLSGSSLISSWHPWYASDNSEFLFGARKMTNQESYDQSDSITRTVYNLLKDALDLTAKDYCAKLGIEMGRQAPISISKYFVDAFMGPHTDSPPEPTTEHISSVLYLNDSYEGGELNFPNQGIRIKPKAGSIVIFPSVPPFVHESTKIISGTKYMSPGFWFLID